MESIASYVHTILPNVISLCLFHYAYFIMLILLCLFYYVYFIIFILFISKYINYNLDDTAFKMMRLLRAEKNFKLELSFHQFRLILMNR